jgi:hypothetical protein
MGFFDHLAQREQLGGVSHALDLEGVGAALTPAA